ncbi:MAG: hypothetical protein M3498_15610 [Deinococcota bacterium]|jgi:vacuolar-type H+-ATPase subunit E/Vma4|nr:hypothetical protein [Deinococcota bacterium]
MADTVAEMTREELEELIEAAVEQKLLELLGDPDEGLELHEVVRQRLVEQKRTVASGERGAAFEDVVRDLGLD